MKIEPVKLFLRVSLAAAFLSAVADRFGFWPTEVSAWGTWASFIDYTGVLNPWAPSNLVPGIAFIATAAEVILAVCLLLGFRTVLVAQASGYLLLVFGLAMAATTGIKAPLDYSVFSASAAAFGLSFFRKPFLEIDSLFKSKT